MVRCMASTRSVTPRVASTARRLAPRRSSTWLLVFFFVNPVLSVALPAARGGCRAFPGLRVALEEQAAAIGFGIARFACLQPGQAHVHANAGGAAAVGRAGLTE